MKTKDFNLEEALNGATVVYGGKFLCKLYHIPESKTYPYLVVLKNDGEPLNWYNESQLTNKFKLLDETPLIERWVNVYSDGKTLWTGRMYPSRRDAVNTDRGEYYLKTIRITNETGGEDE